jgi:hypothetical protein
MANGLLTLSSIGAPDSLETLTASAARDFAASYTGSPSPELSVADAQYAELDLMVGTKYLDREIYATDGATYQNGKEITYIYVDRDVTITRAAYSSNGNTYPAVSLALRTGWNLIQENSYYTETSGTVNVALATEDVPWVLSSFSSY